MSNKIMDKVYCENCKYYEGASRDDQGYTSSDGCNAPGNTFYTYSSGYMSAKQEVRNHRHREPSLMNQDNNCQLYKQGSLIKIIVITIIGIVAAVFLFKVLFR
ncbi:MAG TPA: hypothetical protein ENH82_13135 [bacterium]|nr:hypothetical protein [bacterium]